MIDYQQIFKILTLLVVSISVKSQHLTPQPVEHSAPEATIASDQNAAPNSIVRTIKQDQQGNFWLATFEGVFKYDGQSFINITREFTPTRFFAAMIDSQGKYWFGSIGSGVYSYDGSSFQQFTDVDGLAGNNVTHIYEDNQGKIWFSTDSGVSLYDGDSFTNYTTKEGLPHNDINAIIKDRKGLVWVASRGELSRFDGSGFTRFLQNDGQPFNNIRSVIEDQDGLIWLGGQDGLWLYDGHSMQQLTTQFVGYVYEDAQGRIWTSSKNPQKPGWVVSRYETDPLFTDSLSATAVWEDEGMTFGITSDGVDGVWFGHLSGACHYDGLDVVCF